ncbi:unnamed protein product [Mytilus coruscus]|uniref:Uncharacterized protein n=1 Tax=Mytilus coruscus TaxID=42192 RepID=A0A6J8CA47_MYTCO|nr:unnamed protein product [Mytilus coruscus]
MQVATKTKLQLNDILVFLGIDDSRENLCIVVSFALEQKDALNEEDTMTEKPPKIEKKETKTSENKSSGNRPNFAAALLLKLVCNKEEEAVLDTEQKLLKIFGKNDVQSDNYNMQSHNLYLHATGLMGGSFEQAQGQTDGMPPRFLGSPRRRRPRDSIHNGEYVKLYTVSMHAMEVIDAWVPAFYEFIQDAFAVDNKRRNKERL